MVAPKYVEKSLRAVANEMAKYMTDPEEVRHVSRALAACGVRYVVVETLPKAEIDGVCFWLDSNSPVIGMTTRHDRIDNFWFVLRHEIEHVLQRDGMGALVAEKVDIRIERGGAGLESVLPLEDRRDNLEAAAFCVPRPEDDRGGKECVSMCRT